MTNFNISADEVKKVIADINGINDLKAKGNYDEIDAAERAAMLRTLRMLGFGIERDENGYIVSVMRNAQIIVA